MRLGQLARKLELRPSEIVEFLATKSIQIEEGSNTKMEAAQVTLALQHFAPNMLVEDVPDAEIRTDATPDPEINSAETILQEDEVVAIVTTVAVNETSEEKVEIIKAPKVELSGLKVIGKIDLPETKKKEPEAAAENTEAVSPKESRKPTGNQNFKRQQRPVKNPIALQREQEAQAAREKREEEIRLQKERRTQNYLKKVKAPQPTKAARLIKEQTEEMSAAELAEPPKTLWGKFMRWLTT